MEPVRYPLDGVLDLHAFDPAEIEDLVAEYVRACHAQGLRRVRIIHGKGRGVLRRRVHRVLEGLPLVASYHLAYEDASSWGATIAHLVP
ncbi:MAG: DNA mismatch repair protein MutS [Bacteroidetes bacterium]|nr:MAG: DNA mismatch repair protein MutS [Bacteroidota bacterium]